MESKLRPLLSVALALTVPLADTCAALITTDTTLNAGDPTYDGHEIIVSNCTLTVNGPHTFASLLLTSNAVLTCDAASTGLVVTVTGDLAMETNCVITVAGKGFQGTDGKGSGPGGGDGHRWLDRIGGSGAGHGGEGGIGSSGYGVGICHGSLTEPVTWGSAGGAGSGYQGANGGGALHLMVAGTLRSDGLISANGSGGGAGSWGAAGGGAGGSIWINAAVLAGSGSISASGGAGGTGSRGTGGGGGGGRIALYLDSDQFGGTVNAVGAWGAQYGGAGTVYRKLAGQPEGELRLDNAGNSGGKSTMPEGSWTFTDLVGRGRAQLEISTNTSMSLLAPVFTTRTNFDLTISGQLLCSTQPNGTFTRVEVVDGASVTNKQGSLLRCEELRAAAGGTLVLNGSNALFCSQAEVLPGGSLLLNRPAFFDQLHVATNGVVSLTSGETNLFVTVSNLVVAAGGRITVDGKGFPGTDGTGGGPGGGQGTRWLDLIGGSGAGHGGEGGKGSSGYGVGIGYGSLTEPVTWGSAGGAGSGFQGGNGGGTLRLLVAGTLHNDGLVSAHGNSGGAGSWGAAGGGAGGSIWISAAVLAGSGSISANGGAGGAGLRGTGGGGGGGRIALYLESDQFTGLVSATGAWGTQYGGAGTVFRKLSSQSVGELWLNNEDNSGAKTVLPAGTWDFENLIGRGHARLEISSNAIVNVAVPVLTAGTNFEFAVFGNLLCATRPGGVFARVAAVDNAVLTLGPGSGLRCTELGAASGGTFILDAADALFCEQAEALPGGTLLLNRPVAFSELHVATNGVVSHATGETNLFVTVSNLLVDSGGRVSVDGKGFSGTDGKGAGPGGGEGQRWVDWIGGGGGGYGGVGGNSSSGHKGGVAYGTLAEPTDWGSAGGAASQTQGSAGGGAMRLIVSDTLRVNGQITANGINGIAGSYGSGGGGSGGSIWITTRTLEGSGSINANGGAGGDGPRGKGGGGGGGRVAVYLETNLFTGVLTTVAGWGYQSGTNGTHYRFLNPPRLALSNNGTSLGVAWASESWVTYQLLSATNLDGTWIEVTPLLNGTGGLMQTNLPTSESSAEFFRLRWVEP